MKTLKILLLITCFGFAPIRSGYQQVYIEWTDIVSTDTNWHEQEEIDDWLETVDNVVHQSGFIYREDDQYLIIVDSFFTDNLLGAVTKIPKGCIIKRVKI